MDEAKNQIFDRRQINGVDVAVWMVRHAGWLIYISGILGAMLLGAWKTFVKPEVECIAKELDKPIIEATRKNADLNKETFYIVKKMELVQKRTAPPDAVREAEEEIEIEKIRGVR